MTPDTFDIFDPPRPRPIAPEKCKYCKSKMKDQRGLSISRYSHCPKCKAYFIEEGWFTADKWYLFCLGIDIKGDKE
ncbi:MAG: hypothetical protein HQ552_01295 [Desulfobacteraceae bacterium]|nr:hypothetical protein [Desulfobacteraceae bacterium]